MENSQKRERLEDETIECIERRRSTRIIALEEKKREEKEKKKALELERKKNAQSRRNEKGKAKINEVYELSDDSSDEEQGGPNQHGCRGEALQLNKEGHGGTSRTNVSSIPEIIKTIIEVLQRDDPDLLFSEPANLDVVENPNPIVKQPMDFATMLARMYDGYYTTLDLFKRDVFLMCSNAVFTNPPNSRHYKVAKDMFAHARRIFDDISAELEQCALELSLNNNKTPVREQHDSQRRTSRNARATPKSAGKNKAIVSEVENRGTYLTPSRNPSILTEFQQVDKQGIQFIQDPSNYRESLLKFVGDLGPTAKRVAARKLQGIEFQQLPPNPNSIDSCDASSSLNNRPLTLLPDTSTQQNRYGNYWHAYSAAFLANAFFNSADKGGRNNNNSGVGVGVGFSGGSSNARGTTLEIGNRFSNNTPIPFKEGSSRHHELQLGNPRNASTLVLPTVVIPNAKSGAGSSSGSRPPPLFPPQQGYRPNLISLSNLSLRNQPRATQSSLIGSSILPQQIMTHSNVPRINTTNYNNNNNNNNHLNLNIARQQHVVRPQQVANFANESDTSQYSFATPCKPGYFQALLESSLDMNNSSPYQMQPNQTQFLHQAVPYITPPTTQRILPSSQMQVTRQMMNLQTPPHLQQPRQYSTNQMNQVPSEVMNLQTSLHLQQPRQYSTSQMNQVSSQMMNLQTSPHLQQPMSIPTSQMNHEPSQMMNLQAPTHQQQPRQFATNQMNRKPSQVMNLETPSHQQQPRPLSTSHMNQIHSQVMNLRAPPHLQPPRHVPTLPIPFGSALIGGASTSHYEDADAVQFTWDVEEPPNLNLGL